mmetsp:Transcript_24920/g.61414  ORF Transcript_24920/g.61414 Transcript_24920/m.61414 type:complete len:423 (-) Transcript_24920:113-1381(-)|eukprot:CAMPEP_0197578720 /NCGR_PEP_ID=MMETSP1326-20131121/2830_1 /TAXON_ID=1155430 /ORGANISM="Genus nov. species nov., Strain RCC2288" /LENGTH=422 /DNA_ID=CAMNT_0043141951 /DNA_START=55 /DNA_END=1323 /DNA_ORIENTATION=-
MCVVCRAAARAASQGAAARRGIRTSAYRGAGVPTGLPFARAVPALATASASLQQQIGARVGQTRAMPSPFAASALLPRGNHDGCDDDDHDHEDEDDEDDDEDEVLYPDSRVVIGRPAPAFKGPAVVDGEITNISLKHYAGKWVVLFFYPKDFTFVCPTEIIAFSDRAPEFAALNTQLIAASTDTEESHLAWIQTPRTRGGLGHMQIPILADTKKTVAAHYGVLMKDKGIALRGLFIIDPAGVLQQITMNNLPVGRSVDEALRLVKAFQFVAEHGEVCPANWTPGAATMGASQAGSADYFASANAAEDAPDFAANPKLTPIRSKAEYDAMVATGKPLMVDFYAPWCGKCRQIAPTIDKLIEQHPGVTFAKFDTADPALASVAVELGVEQLPVFRFFKGGKQAAPDVVGYKPKPLGDAVKALAK